MTAAYESWNPIVQVCSGAMIPMTRAESASASHLPVFLNDPAAILYMKIIVHALMTEGEQPENMQYMRSSKRETAIVAPLPPGRKESGVRIFSSIE